MTTDKETTERLLFDTLIESIEKLKEVIDWEFNELKTNPYYKAHKDHQPLKQEEINFNQN